MQRILLVEDDIVLAADLESTLNSAGYYVLSCGTQFDALNYLDMEPDVGFLIADIKLSDGSSGWDLAEHARMKRPELPVLYITGCSQNEHSTRGVSGSSLLEKPISADLLVQSIGSILGPAG